jgi:hypothetical protein
MVHVGGPRVQDVVARDELDVSDLEDHVKSLAERELLDDFERLLLSIG